MSKLLTGGQVVPSFTRPFFATIYDLGTFLSSRVNVSGDFVSLHFADERTPKSVVLERIAVSCSPFLGGFGKLSDERIVNRRLNVESGASNAV